MILLRDTLLLAMDGNCHPPKLIDPCLNLITCRRICPGRHFAELSLWAAIVSILSTVRITKATDSEGKDIPVIPGYTTGLAMFVLFRWYLGSADFFCLNSQPTPFDFAITSIDSRREEHMRAASRVYWDSCGMLRSSESES
jgi:hypothetical protein